MRLVCHGRLVTRASSKAQGQAKARRGSLCAVDAAKSPVQPMLQSDRMSAVPGNFRLLGSLHEQ